MDTLPLVASLALLLLPHLPGAMAGSRCTTTSGSYAYTAFCEHGCCETTGLNPCCGYNGLYVLWAPGSIAGVVIGNLVGIGIFVCLIVLTVRICRKKRQVVNPQPVDSTGTNVHVLHINPSGATGASVASPAPPPPYGANGQGAAPHGQNLPPDSSNPKGQPPPAFPSTDPAFPPASTSFNNHPPPAPANPIAADANSATNS